MLRRTSLGTLGLIVGGTLTLGGFVSYFADLATLNLVGFFYGIPLLLGGLALKASELKPVPHATPTPEIVALRSQQATATQSQLFKDVTRYRYGQTAHLDSSLSRLGLSPMDEDRPVLQLVREEARQGAYSLVLVFDSPAISFETWQQKQEKIAAFFGPGIRAEVQQPAEHQIELALISTSSTSENSTSS